MKREIGRIVLIAAYVDNLSVASTCMDTLIKMKRLLSTQLKRKDLRESKMILVIEIFRDRPQKSLFICKSRYMSKVLEQIGMQTANGSGMSVQENLDLHQGLNSYNLPYQELICYLLNLSDGTRPDIALAVAKHYKIC